MAKTKPENQPHLLLLEGKDPGDLSARHVDLSNLSASQLEGIRGEIQCHSLDLSGSELLMLPAAWRASYRLALNGCAKLESLPENLSVSTLELKECKALKALPEGLSVNYLDMSGCSNLTSWPPSATVRYGNVSVRGCQKLRQLPPGLGPLASLDVRDCPQIEALPEDIVIRSWIELAGSGLTGLPESIARTPLRWKGVQVNAQIVFFPETLSVSKILDDPNAEVRRVMMERVGFERFFKEANADVIHQDRDPGGERRLYRLRLEGDEDLICVSVKCPSTGRQYLIRVPPTMATCHQAVAWTAGFDNAADYNPLVET